MSLVGGFGLTRTLEQALDLLVSERSLALLSQDIHSQVQKLFSASCSVYAESLRDEGIGEREGQRECFYLVWLAPKTGTPRTLTSAFGFS